MVEGPAGATGGVGGTVPDPSVTGRVADVDWAARAGTAERAIVRRHLRRLGGVIPGTRIGRIRWPRLPPVKPWPWHYWWQAHLLDCLVDAQLRAPRPGRADTIAAVARTVRLRNLGSWTNDYYDDVAWFGLAVQRAGTLARRSPGRRSARSPCSCATGGARTAAAGSGGGAGTTSRTPPPTARPRSCWPAAATSGWRRPSSTGCTTRCSTRRRA
jgi:hypothetical protein